LVFEKKEEKKKKKKKKKKMGRRKKQKACDPEAKLTQGQIANKDKDKGFHFFTLLYFTLLYFTLCSSFSF